MRHWKEGRRAPQVCKEPRFEALLRGLGIVLRSGALHAVGRGNGALEPRWLRRRSAAKRDASLYASGHRAHRVGFSVLGRGAPSGVHPARKVGCYIVMDYSDGREVVEPFQSYANALKRHAGYSTLLGERR